MHAAFPLLTSLLSSSAVLALTALSLTACTEEAPGEPGLPVLTAPARVDLGAGDCGGAATGTFVLANDGDAPLEFTLESVDPRVAVVPLGGTIPAGETQLVEVQAGVPEGAAAGEVLGASLIARTGGPEAKTIAVAFAARGATLAIEPAMIGIGEQPIGLRAARDFTVRNTGNATAFIAIASPGGEFGGGLAPSELGPGSEHTGRMTYLPRDLGADAASAVITVDGPVCGARPRAIELAGEGVAGQGILLQGGPVEFGTVTCDGADETRTLTLVNPTDLAGTFTAQMWDTDLDDVNFEVRPMQGTIAARGSVELTVKRRDARGTGGAREYHSAVRIVTSHAGSEEIRDVSVHEVLRTAELQVVTETDFGWLPANSVATIPVQITNVGTAPARVTASTASDLVVVLPQWLEPGATATGWVTYTQPLPRTFEGLVSFAASGSCQAPIERTYTAGHGAYAVVHAVESVGACGVVPTEARLWVSNPGTEALEIRCRPAGPSPLGLTFAQASLTVPAGQHRSFDLTMLAGDGAPGTVSADVECIANDGARATWEHHTTTVTRTIVAPDESCDMVQL